MNGTNIEFFMKEETMEDLLTEGLMREQKYKAQVKALEWAICHSIIIENQQMLEEDTLEEQLKDPHCSMIEVEFKKGRYKPRAGDKYMNKFTLLYGCK